ncbi:hypothetical protein [Candidatus Berkiella aquae]|uniref:Uncharacterized protein n=1 Tax=Candidatus Berkiella aquae TaxID=295108 RepID=A0A0Q9YWQ7_9GAMM|nr:hypothetical protein [Candidatus Berkiella aquae]MCS5709973.1 hypothetical protein [Candidatus Berkiella aquae]
MRGRICISAILSGVLLTLAPIISHSQNYLGEPNYPTQLTNDEVRELMIQMSIRGYRGKCACPYSPDAIGGICGTESAYYRPGGFKIYCFYRDISSEEVYFWKLKYATPRARIF